ncbi:MAG: YdeI/OmpD-associated family protein [Acidimicrobiia bacterium]
MNSEVDAYIERSDRWPDEMRSLRTILLDAGLTEEIKWSKPCYCHDGANIAIMQEMRGFLALMFFKGALLEDPLGLLRAQGPNSRSAKRFEFTSVDDVTGVAGAIADYVEEAVDVERRGLTIEPEPEPELVEELRQRLEADPELRAAFESLTPGRRREYDLYVSGAKQASTRESRIDRHVERILAGKGLRDR